MNRIPKGGTQAGSSFTWFPGTGETACLDDGKNVSRCTPIAKSPSHQQTPAKSGSERSRSAIE
jgi:hypothetical protein